MPTVQTRMTRPEVHRLFVAVPALLAGRMQDSGGIVRALMIRVGMTALSHIRIAFVAKAHGGVDEAGESWAPLQRSTIANRRPAPHKKRGERPRGLLTVAQDKQWRSIYARQLARFKGDKGHAAAYAWFVLKAGGAKTKLDVYGGQTVEMLRDTGRGLNSLSPGVKPPDFTWSMTSTGAVEGQVFRFDPGAVIVGTNVKYMVYHHRGVPGRLPQRRLWPRTLPATWWKDIGEQARAGVVQLITALLGRT